jgi:hypothetical protein
VTTDSQNRPEEPKRRHQSRVWAEERDEGQVLLTWQRSEPPAEEADAAADARAVAATVGVLGGVSAATTVDDGVLVTFDPEVVNRQQLAGSVRAALNLDADLKTRGNEMMKRVPAYFALAKALALDERVSPVPEAARQAAQSRGTPMRAAGALPVATRFIPGFPLISKLQTLVPVLRALGSWSREASPEVVDEHLTRSGLTREQLDRDLATSPDAVIFARDYATEAAGRAVNAATAAARQARQKTRDWARQYAERGDNEPQP